MRKFISVANFVNESSIFVGGHTKEGEVQVVENIGLKKMFAKIHSRVLLTTN